MATLLKALIYMLLLMYKIKTVSNKNPEYNVKYIPMKVSSGAGRSKQNEFAGFWKQKKIFLWVPITLIR